MDGIESHALDLLRAAWWLVTALGAMGLGTIIWGGKQVLRRLDDQDATMMEIRDLLASEISKLRELQHSMDLRLTRVEERCQIATGGTWPPRHHSGSNNNDL